MDGVDGAAGDGSQKRGRGTTGFGSSSCMVKLAACSWLLGFFILYPFMYGPAATKSGHGIINSNTWILTLCLWLVYVVFCLGVKHRQDTSTRGSNHRPRTGTGRVKKTWKKEEKQHGCNKQAQKQWESEPWRAERARKEKNEKRIQSRTGIEPDVGVEPTTLRWEISWSKSLTLYRLS